VHLAFLLRQRQPRCDLSSDRSLFGRDRWSNYYTMLVTIQPRRARLDKFAGQQPDVDIPLRGEIMTTVSNLVKVSYINVHWPEITSVSLGLQGTLGPDGASSCYSDPRMLWSWRTHLQVDFRRPADFRSSSKYRWTRMR
jgi:hypothetical protein